MTESEAARFNVLLEDVQRTVKFLAEGHVVLVERLVGVDKRLDGVDRRLDAMSNDLQQLRTDVDDMRTSFDTRLTRVEKALNGKLASPAAKSKRVVVKRSKRK
jgi:hypothetical protein